MITLSEKIRLLRGEQTQKQFAQKCGVSERLVSGVEALGESVHLNTLRLIGTGCCLNQDAWLDLLIAWIKEEVGADYLRLKIEKAEDPNGSWMLQERTNDDVLQLFNVLNRHDQDQIIKAMQRPEARRCLPAINEALDRVYAEQTDRMIKDDQPIKLT